MKKKTLFIILSTLILLTILSLFIYKKYKNDNLLVARIGVYNTSLNKITTTKLIKEQIDVYDIIKIYVESETFKLSDNELSNPNYNIIIDIPKEGVGYISSDIWVKEDSIIVKLNSSGQYKIISKENDSYFRKILSKQ